MLAVHLWYIPRRSDLSLHIPASDLVLDTVEWQLTPEKFEKLSFKIFGNIWLKVKKIQVCLVIHDFTNR
jgi:hypothetical protein